MLGAAEIVRAVVTVAEIVVAADVPEAAVGGAVAVAVDVPEVAAVVDATGVTVAVAEDGTRPRPRVFTDYADRKTRKDRRTSRSFLFCAERSIPHSLEKHRPGRLNSERRAGTQRTPREFLARATKTILSGVG